MRKTVIFGAGSLAQICCYHLQSTSPDCVSGFLVDPEFRDNDTLMGLPVVSTGDMKEAFPAESFDMLVAVGYSNMRKRNSVANRMSSEGYRFTDLIPDNNYGGSISGSNNIIMPGSIIEPFASIGSNNIIWSGAHICHDTIIGDNNFFATGSIVGGYAKVSSGCFLGFGSVVIEKLTIADETLVAAGAVVTKNTEACSKYVGVPAKKSGEHADTGIIL